MLLRAWNPARGIAFASSHHWNEEEAHTEVSFSLQSPTGPVYKQLRQVISLTYDETNGAVSSRLKRTLFKKLLIFSSQIYHR